jgi:outer membrane protein assembly factor BamB
MGTTISSKRTTGCTSWIRPAPELVFVLCIAGLGGCADSLPSMPKLQDLNPFAVKQTPLLGTRVAIMQAPDKVAGELAPADRALTIPAQSVNAAWTQPGGFANNAPGHLALAGSVKQVWSADAGTGSSSNSKLTANPIVVDGRVFTLDAASQVRSLSTANGAQQWRVSLVPEKRSAPEGFGGGIASDSGRLYVATGFGNVHALDPQTGKQLWIASLGVPVRASPTAAADRVFVITTDGRFVCLAGADGRELWSYRGLPEKTSLISNPSPAVDGDTVVVPYPSGELVALNIQTGKPVWTESLARTRIASAMAAITDAARPVIDGDTVFAVGHGGRMIATQRKSGERLWSLNIAGTQAPSVAGDAVFVVDTNGQLMAITRRDGKVVWTTNLPGGAATWSGPTLAGGMLWLTSNKGQLTSVDAATGKVAATTNLGGAIYTSPVVAQGRMFVLNDNARLFALN